VTSVVAPIVEIADGAGGSVWVVDMWGGGYIASEPPQEFLGPYATEATATTAMHSLGFFDGSDVQMGDLPDFRQELDAQVRWRFDG
jgi:hypothetical protein